MKKTYYNTDNITCIKVLDQRLDEDYVYRSEKKLFGIVIQKEGFYYLNKMVMYQGNETPENYIRKGNNLFIKPRVIHYYTDGNRVFYYFDTFKQAEDFGRKYTASEKWIK